MSPPHPIVLETFQTGHRPRIFINSLTAIRHYLPEACPTHPRIVMSSTEIRPTRIFCPSSLACNRCPHVRLLVEDYHSPPLPHLIMTDTFDSFSPTSTLSYPADCELLSTALIGDSKPVLVKLEMLHWRLASGFFAYFICGWCEGGKLFKSKNIVEHAHSPHI